MSYADRDAPLAAEEQFTSGMEDVTRARYVLLVPAGRYEAPSLPRLVWQVLRHRFGHLVRDGRWGD